MEYNGLLKAFKDLVSSDDPEATTETELRDLRISLVTMAFFLGKIDSFWGAWDKPNATEWLLSGQKIMELEDFQPASKPQEKQ